MARQGVTAGNETKLSKGKLRPNNSSKFLENEISRSQTPSRLESWTGTAEVPGGHFRVPQRGARPSQHSVPSPAPAAGSQCGRSAEPPHEPGAG